MKILVTGSGGLVGVPLTEALRASGFEVVAFDLVNSPDQDIRTQTIFTAALKGVSGVIHLAAVSRVAVAERDPILCHSVNEDAVQRMVTDCAAMSRPPWFLFASSREVYGNQDMLPVKEDTALRPLNVYARSKFVGESLVLGARATLPAANIIRLANVYGRVDDHPDRVVPAFARAAAFGGEILISGSNNTFDFVHVDDVVRGLMSLVELTSRGINLQAVHLATGQGTSLIRLANLAKMCARAPLYLIENTPKAYEVTAFVGDTTRAAEVLGWRFQTRIEEGMSRLVEDFCNRQSLRPTKSAKNVRNLLDELHLQSLTG